MKKYISTTDAFAKMQRYCAYQERCHQEVRNKLLELGIFGDDLDNIITALIEDNYLNEERFACTFARGKFRIKQWGKIRIRQELQMRQVSDYCIRKAMQEISAGEYLETLRSILDKKSAALNNGLTEYERRNKVAQYAVQRGFESDMIWALLNERN